MINFWSYKNEYKKYGAKFNKFFDQTLKSGQIFFGPNLKNFEYKFLKKYKSKYGVAVGSGTDALLISLMSINIKNGDEVITASNTAIPTISAIVNSGAKPVLVDIKEDYLIDTDKIEKKITKKTKAIIPVHLYGKSCDMEKIIKISKKYKLSIIEDCAQSQGAKFNNKFVGTFGSLGCFSFYPTKILGGYGDGGFILTNDFNTYKKIKRLRFYGIETVENHKYKDKYYSFENGLNSRLDEIQASILNFKLKKTDDFIRKRRNLAKIYIKELSSTKLTLPRENDNNEHVYHLFTVSHPKREKIIQHLLKRKIQTRIIYPYPIQNMMAYKSIIKNRNRLKNSVKKASEIFCLPLYPELNVKEVKYICKTLKEILVKI